MTLARPEAAGTAVAASCSTAGRASTVALRDTAISGFATHLSTWAGAGAGDAQITTAYSAYETTRTATSGGTVTHGAGVLDGAELGLAGPADPRPVAGSPLVDAGDPIASASTTDLAGNPRVAGGRADIGAFELVPPAPAPSGPATGDAPAGPVADAAGTPVTPTDAPSADPAPQPPTVSADAIRAALREAIATTTGRRHTLRAVAPGRARFAWRSGGRRIAVATLTLPQAGTATLKVQGGKRLRRALRHEAPIRVRATFALADGTTVAVRAKRPR